MSRCLRFFFFTCKQPTLNFFRGQFYLLNPKECRKHFQNCAPSWTKQRKKITKTSSVCQRRTSSGSGLFAHLSRDFEQTFKQIVFIRVRTPYKFGDVKVLKKRKRSHFRSTCVHEKRCCLKIRKNGQQKTCNLSCNIAAKRVEKRCCAFYHPQQTCLATNQVVNRFERKW